MLLAGFFSPVVFVALALSGSIIGIKADATACAAKYESEYEDACMRGYRMKTLADGQSPRMLSGVTCSNSCADTYKSNEKLIEACKFGCDIKQPIPSGDNTLPVDDMFSRMREMMANGMKHMVGFFRGPHQLIPLDTTASDDKSQSPEDHSHITVKRVRIVVPLGHPELATVQRSSQEFDGGSDPFAVLKRVRLGSPFEDATANENVLQEKPVVPAVMHKSDEDNSEGHSWFPHFRFIVRTPSENEDSTGTSLRDRLSCIMHRINPVLTFLAFVMILSVVLLVVQLIVSCCRRRRRSQNHEYTALPTYFEDHYHAYPDNYEVKQKDVENFDTVKSKEAMGV